ncbi:MAG: hypothetical protein HY741_20360 [Chloroflexi bacterium]|nr:hypothetical protein [Chloroflexota bacterium]
MAVRDLKTEWLRVKGYRAMTPQRRFEIAQGLIHTGRMTVERAIQQQRPNLSARDLEIELWNRIYGRGWAERMRSLARKGKQNMEDWRVVSKIIQVLEEHGIPYAIVGGYSAIYWGRPRFTQDADLLVDLKMSQVNLLVEALADEFVISREAIQDAIRLRSEFNLIHQAEVFKTDLWIVPNTPYDRQVLERRRRGELGDGAVYYQSPEDTILSKLRWCKAANFSERQFGDALGVYEIQERTLDQSYLDHWARVLDVAGLLEKIRAEAALPPDV